MFDYTSLYAIQLLSLKFKADEVSCFVDWHYRPYLGMHLLTYKRRLIDLIYEWIESINDIFSKEK